MSPQEHLYRLAYDARNTAYAPYSGFAVGSALLATDGNYYSGCNVENISYPCGNCAEQSAISAMIVGGSKLIAEIIVIADSQDLITPCGACLQRIKEFSTPDTIIHLANLSGQQRSINLQALLPLAFNSAELKK